MRSRSPKRSNGLTIDRRAEGAHPFGNRSRHGTGDDRHVGAQQRGGHHDGEVRLVVVGEDDHAFQVPVTEAGKHEMLGIARIGGESRHVGTERLQLEVVDARLVDVDDDEATSKRIERAAERATGLPVAGHQDEGLAQAAHLAREALHGKRMPEAAVLRQREQRADRVRPPDHREVDGDRDPQALRVGEGVRNLAEADRRRRVAHEVERVEEAHRPRRALRVLPRNQRQAEHAHRVDRDQHDERRAHPPQDQEDRGRRRRGSRQRSCRFVVARERRLQESEQRIHADRAS